MLKSMLVGGVYMLDLFFLILTVAFFAGCLAYILGCERL
jgi:hypothetical protein